MNEKDFYFSINEYEEKYKSSNYAKRLQWDMAIGLQEVDNLKPSKYLEKLLEENVEGNLTIEEVEKELREYYIEKENKNEINHNELECDFVSARIVELLNKDIFELSVDYLKYVHKFLFQDVYEFAGEFRKINFSKHEKILNNDSVTYGNCYTLTESLEYDISLEKVKKYKEMNIVEVINNITKFSSNIWQAHPFREGNTRTTALFIEKYLISLGFTVNNLLFKEKSVYYRNAFVRSNYFNNEKSIKADDSYLKKFYENLLLGKNNDLHLEDLIVKELICTSEVMSRISPEKEILYISKVIDKNIYYYNMCLKDKGFLSENILSQLRNLVEDVVILLNNKINHLELDIHYNNIRSSFAAIKIQNKYNFLCEFHSFLQGTASHYTPSEDVSVRLVKHYFGYICSIKKLLKEEFNLDIINNIDLFPMYDDMSMKENYDIICDKIENIDLKNGKLVKGKFYVEKTNVIFSKGNIYYEITLSKATDYNNKFERLTFYSKFYIPDNYSININSVDEIVELNIGKVKIKVITDFKVAIRTCELKNLFKIFGENKSFDDNYKEYRNLMNYLTDNKCTINTILLSNTDDFRTIIEDIKDGAENHYICSMLEKMRYIVVNNKPGCNIVRYLTTKTINTVVRDQIGKKSHPYLSGLYIHKKSGMFDAMPYAMSLHNHNPRFYDLIKAIDVSGKDDELLYSFIRNNIESNDELYTPISEIEAFQNIPELVEKFNNKIKSKLGDTDSVLVLDNNFLYIKEYEKNSIKIIKKLDDHSSKINPHLNQIVEFYLKNLHDDSISKDKISILKYIFKNSSIAFIYGPAGTGKTKMIELLSNAFKNYNKCLIAQTNTAVANLNLRLQEDENLSILTINNYIKNYNEECDLLIIDECSTVSNKDMLKILKKDNYRSIVMVGDIYQIESIQYGNWFKICSRYFKKGISFELEMTHRTSDPDLLNLWKCVRSSDKRLSSIMGNKEYTEDISNAIFTSTSEDEVILCLNYDGMYGINNINKIKQISNKNKEYNFGVDVFKIGDPVLFNDCPRFNGFLHNNLKGIIINIEDAENAIWFSIEVDKGSITPKFAPYDVILLDSEKSDKIVIKFKVNEFKDKDDDENEYDHIIPFNLSYAISIHKAQGLEYDSVKVVITSNIEDRITKNIFYTAMTRAKQKLKVYWSAESQKRIIDSFNKKDNKRDLSILNQKIKEHV